MRSFSLSFLVLTAGMLSGCHSAVITATVTNHTHDPISLIQVDYPSASFGAQAVAPGASYTYPFKVIGSGPVHLSYTDAAGHEHRSDGPELRESDDGGLRVDVSDQGITWNMQRRVSTH